jgi:PBP1b-binding outer membrane lipoprotein LpoB
MRICILCEESKVLQAREKMKNDNILKIGLSPTGNLPATHKMCVIAVTEQKAQEMINSAELTIIEAMNPKEFLEKHNLKKIGKIGLL